MRISDWSSDVCASDLAAEVAEHGLALADHPVARFVVRAGRVGAGGDDGEVHTVVALGQDPPAELGRHVSLGAPDQLDLAGLELGGDAVDGRSGPSQRLDRSEEHTSELQSLMRNSYAVFCLKKK